MKPSEIQLLSGFLDELNEKFSCDGCNDYDMEDTPENRELFISGRKREEPGLDADEYEVRIGEDGRIECHNQTILGELHYRLLHPDDE